MTSALAESSGWLTGCQQPRVRLVPDGEDHPDADAVVEFGAALGIVLDPWQETVLRGSLRRRDGRWAAFAVGVCAPRQNGKNAVTEVRELAGPVLLGERLVIHTAHLADTCEEAFRRMDEIIDANEWLSAEVKHVWRANGKQAIEFKNGGRIRFRTRTRGGGRGYSGDLVMFDEAMYLPEVSMGAILPVVSARPDPQIWYAGSAVDQDIHEDGVVFSRVRHRAIEGTDPRLAYSEWSWDADSPDDVTDQTAGDPAVWAVANPALGIRINTDYVADERRELDPRTFAVERLCVGDWPPVNPGEGGIIDTEAFQALADDASEIRGGLLFVFDVNPDRTWSSVAAAGFRADGKLHLEVVERRRGTGWVRPWLSERVDRHQPGAVMCAEHSPAAALVRGLGEEGVDVVVVGSSDYAKACGEFFDLVDQAGFRYPTNPSLLAAVKGARTRTLGDAWAWSRKNSTVDISPLVAVTLAAWAAPEYAVTTQAPRIW